MKIIVLFCLLNFKAIGALSPKEICTRKLCYTAPDKLVPSVLKTGIHFNGLRESADPDKFITKFSICRLNQKGNRVSRRSILPFWAIPHKDKKYTNTPSLKCDPWGKYLWFSFGVRAFAVVDVERNSYAKFYAPEALAGSYGGTELVDVKRGIFFTRIGIDPGVVDLEYLFNYFYFGIPT